MTFEDLVRITDAKGSGKKRRAKCPVHKSRGLTLAVYDDGYRLDLRCMAGCDKDAVLAAYGLVWKHLLPKLVATPESRRKALIHGRLEVWERILALAHMLRYPEAKIERAEQEIIWMRRELYPDRLLPAYLRGERHDAPPHKRAAHEEDPYPGHPIPRTYLFIKDTRAA